MNGIWSNRCFRYGKLHETFQNLLTFSSIDKTCDGYGEDLDGSFPLTGSFSKKTQQIDIFLSYKVC